MTADIKTRQCGIVAIMAVCLALAGCAGAQQAQKGGQARVVTDESDPLENINRTTFAVNDALDRALVAPAARGYRAVVPKPARTGLRNFLRNLRSPVNVANQALQGDVQGVAHDLSRFVINTSIGLGGLIDVADTAGLDYEYEDFGQTLAVWGVGHGPYLVLPVMGPSSVRDATGLLVDTYADPVRLYLYNTHNENWYYGKAAVAGLDQREGLLDALDDLRRNSFDYYAALRSAYYQRRAALVQDDAPGAGGEAIPDYDKEE